MKVNCRGCKKYRVQVNVKVRDQGVKCWTSNVKMFYNLKKESNINENIDE